MTRRRTMDFSLAMAAYAVSTMQHGGRSALPDAPVIAPRPAGGTRRQLSRLKGRLTSILHRTAWAIEPGNGDRMFGRGCDLIGRPAMRTQIKQLVTRGARMPFRAEAEVPLVGGIEVLSSPQLGQLALQQGRDACRKVPIAVVTPSGSVGEERKFS
jgi:hypothetical protein